MKSMEDLQDAFAGESQANRKYLVFAKKADSEGLPQIAKLFRAAAAAETIHALAHLRAMDVVGTTRENLAGAMSGEEFEFTDMYPKFIEDARADDNKRALVSFKNAMAVEQVHFSLYNEAAKQVAEGKDLAERKIYVCSVCGNTVLDNVPEKCPVCGVPASKFDEIE
ncbi:MAG: rubrerythrin family protein [Phycisphaerae bacterium]|nr:rubrerythrin family protein [Phycisphaerae bacterium]